MLILVCFCLIGVIALVVSHASVPSVAIEPEDAVVSAPAQKQSSAPGASNNSYITFTKASGSWWKPARNTKWNWILEGGVTTSNASETARYDMYDVDMQSMMPAITQQTINWPSSTLVPSGYSTTITWPKGDNAGLIAQLHSQGKKVICYIDSGAFEDYRPDASAFPGKWGAGNNRSTDDNDSAASLFGANVPYVGPPSLVNQDPIGGGSDGTIGSFSGEYWLDQRISSWKDVWGPIIWARMDLAKKIGCDGVEGDQNNAYGGNDTTYGVTQNDSLRLYRETYYQSHSRGLTAISKNGVELTDGQVSDPADISYCTPGLCQADGILNEECSYYDECDLLQSAENKQLWIGQAEYKDEGAKVSIANVCPSANSQGRMAIIKPKVQPVLEASFALCWEQ
jgi:hypothetical protein